MWVAKLSIKHDDCVIGTRCKRFNCVSVGVPMSAHQIEGVMNYTHFETLSGAKDDVKRFIRDLRLDSQVKNLEATGNAVFFVYQAKEKVPTAHYDPKIFFLKPVVVDNEGYESWEIGSWEREMLTGFIKALEESEVYVKLQKIENTKLTEIYFPQVMPFLTKHQKQAIELAYQYGYYDYPRKAELKDLAARMGISLSTFREHLRRAEKKIMPDLIRNVRDE